MQEKLVAACLIEGVAVLTTPSHEVTGSKYRGNNVQN